MVFESRRKVCQRRLIFATGTSSGLKTTKTTPLVSKGRCIKFHVSLGQGGVYRLLFNLVRWKDMGPKNSTRV